MGNMRAFLLLMVFAGSSQAQIVNIDAFSNQFGSNPVSIFLSAGTYDIEVIGVAQGGAFDAWHFISGSTGGCDGAGTNCATGWVNRYRADSVALAMPVSEGGPNEFYETPAIALANAVDTSFVLTADAFVDFSIVDSLYTDNLGGMSLQVTPVPLPGALILALSGLFGLHRIRRRRI